MIGWQNRFFFCYDCINGELFLIVGAVLDYTPGQVEGVIDEAGSVPNGDGLRDRGKRVRTGLTFRTCSWNHLQPDSSYIKMTKNNWNLCLQFLSHKSKKQKLWYKTLTHLYFSVFSEDIIVTRAVQDLQHHEPPGGSWCSASSTVTHFINTHLMVVMELLDQQFPVLEVIVDTEVPCLIDVA